MVGVMEFANLEFSPGADAALDQLKAEADAGDISFADALTAAKMLVRINNDPQAVLDNWLLLPGEPAQHNVLAERVEGIAMVFVVVWEARPNHSAYVHDLGWEPRQPDA